MAVCGRFFSRRVCDFGVHKAPEMTPQNPALKGRRAYTCKQGLDPGIFAVFRENLAHVSAATAAPFPIDPDLEHLALQAALPGSSNQG